MTRRIIATALAVIVSAGAVLAGAADYAFEPVNAEVANGAGSELAVRLLNKASGKPVDKAIIFRSRLDMEPEGMAAMTAPLEPMPSTEPGVYRFKANLAMAGQWALKLMAKVQGEKETVQGTVVFKAK